MTDVFGSPEIGSAQALGTKWGNVAGVSTEIVRPETKLVDDQFLPGRTLSFKFSGDKHRMPVLRQSRLYVKYEFGFGEVNESCSDVVKGP